MLTENVRLTRLLPFLPEDDPRSWETRLLYFFSLESFGDKTAQARAAQLVEVWRYWRGRTLSLGDRIPDDVAATIQIHLEAGSAEWFESGIEQWSFSSYLEAREAPLGTPAALGVRTFERYNPVPFSYGFLWPQNPDYRKEVHLPWVSSFMNEVNPYPELRETPFEKLIDKVFLPSLFTLVEMCVGKIILDEEPGDEKFWTDLYLRGTPYMGFADENIGKFSIEPKIPAGRPKFLYK